MNILLLTVPINDGMVQSAKVSEGQPLFVRVKSVGTYQYLQIVESRRSKEGKIQQKVLATLGRADQIGQDGTLDALIESLSRFSTQCLALVAGKSQPQTEARKIGPVLIFERLWRSAGIPEILAKLLEGRKFEFDIERALFLTVLHRICHGGSDRDADAWREGYRIEGMENLSLHQVYRAMAWVGEESAEDDAQLGRTPFAPRCVKDQIEEALFSRRRDLFMNASLVFFDTTSLYFEGAGGQSIGARGHNKDHRPDLKQMVLGVVLDGEGQPICCELWPGNTADVKTLIPVVDRLRTRFGIAQVCVVADRGMISKETMAALEERQWQYILGARMRAVNEVRDEVVAKLQPAGQDSPRAGFTLVQPERQHQKDPSPLQVTEVAVGGHRYIVCYNPEQARKDAHDREAIVGSLQEQLKQGDKTLVGNKGYRKYLKAGENHFQIDSERVQGAAAYDGLWVLRTNTQLAAVEVARQYKLLWRVERIFRDSKTLLRTRPIFHKWDETIRGHTFCSFLALVLLRELDQHLSDAGVDVEWSDLLRDLEALQVVRVEHEGKSIRLRSQCQGCCGRVFQAVGVAIPPLVMGVN